MGCLSRGIEGTFSKITFIGLPNQFLKLPIVLIIKRAQISSHLAGLLEEGGLGVARYLLAIAIDVRVGVVPYCS